MANARVWIAIGIAIGVLVAALAIRHALRRRPKPREEDEPLISLVLLLKAPRQLDEDDLARTATQALGVDLTSKDEEATSFVVGESPLFVMKVEGLFFLVNNAPEPYVLDIEAEAAKLPDLRLARAFREHRAWLSVDLVGTPEDEDLAQAYQIIGKLVAELAGDDCLAIYSPATGRMNLLDDAVLATLRGPKPLLAFAEPTVEPVIGVADDDPRMKAAVAEARRRWPEFLAAFRQRQPNQPFLVKAPFCDGEHTEFMWVLVARIEGETIHGTLENEPVGVKSVKKGDQVEVGLADVNDWAYSEGGEMRGGFTMKVLAESQKRR